MTATQVIIISLIVLAVVVAWVVAEILRDDDK